MTATTKNDSGTTVAGDSVQFATVPGVPGSCGMLVPATGITNALGQTSVTYTASTTPGACTIKATEAQTGGSGSTTITQTPAGASQPNTVTVTAVPSSLPAGGTSNSTVTATVTNPNGFAVAGDAVTFFLALANPPGACGTAGPVTGNPPGTTDASGRVALLYFPSTTVGFCEIIAKDSSGGKGAVTITQTRNPLGTPNTVAVVANPSTIPADGLSTSTVTVTVTGPGGAVGGDPVAITLSPAAICGGITPLPGSTSAIGQVTVTYLGSTKPGPCAITATEAMTNASGSVTITQAQPANTITLTANPSSILANGMSTSVITATVTGAGGAPVGGDMVTFSFPLPAPASCGTLNPPVANNTNAVGQVTVTYTASTTVGFCTIKATEASGASGIVTITQHL